MCLKCQKQKQELREGKSHNYIYLSGHFRNFNILKRRMDDCFGPEEWTGPIGFGPVVC